MTTQTIEVRTKSFRNLIIGVVGITLISLVWAVVQVSWLPLLGWLLLLPLCGIFLYIDSHMVDKWQRRILEMWIQNGLDLDIFCDAMSQICMLPKRMLQGMMNTLPIQKNSVDRHILPPGSRKVLAITLQTINRSQGLRTISAAIAYSLVSASFASAAIWWSWLPLLGLVFIPAIIGVGKWLNSLLVKKLKNQFKELQKQEASEFNHFVKVAWQLDWGPISDVKRAQLLSY